MLDISITSRSAEFRGLVSSAVFTDGSENLLDLEDGILHTQNILRTARDNGRNVFLAGNGGSAAIASHSTTDFLNVAKLRAHTLHDPSLLTCMTNDYGYENAYSRILSQLADKEDVLIAISSSGQSKNIRNVAITMKEIDGTVITFSGFDKDNPLRSLGNINVWLDSHDYGLVEIGHLFILHNIADRFGVERKQEKDDK